MSPQTRYVKSGDVSIAYQVVGNGPLDLVYLPGWVSNVELFWEDPYYASFLTRLASFSRLILLDKRGTGLSDRVFDLPSLEVRMDDLRVVLDAVGSSSAALFGTSEGGAMCTLFAATYPQRVSALIMQAAFARQMVAPDYPWGRTQAHMDAVAEDIAKNWGTAVQLERRVPSLANDEHFRERWARRMRLSATAAVAGALIQINTQIDIRDVLPAIRVPTLLLHSVRDMVVDVGHSRYLASKIPGAKLVELDSADHFPIGADADIILDEIEEFLTGVRRGPEPDRVLATIMFTDIVDATSKAVSMGDRRWHEILDMHHLTVRRALGRFRGREIDTAGDGFFAAFDGPARAVRCACAISNDLKLLGVEVRAGVHTGECEVMGDKLGGISVHIGARVAALAQANEVFVSSTVKDLVAGSGLLLDDRGSHTLKGIPGSWRLFAAQH